MIHEEIISSFIHNFFGVMSKMEAQEPRLINHWSVHTSSNSFYEEDSLLEGVFISDVTITIDGVSMLHSPTTPQGVLRTPHRLLTDSSQTPPDSSQTPHRLLTDS
jgi:hypothetical protein